MQAPAPLSARQQPSSLRPACRARAAPRPPTHPSAPRPPPRAAAAAAAAEAAAEAAADAGVVFAAVTPGRGFLPEREFGAALPHASGFAAYEQALAALPDLVLSSDLRGQLAALPPLSMQQLEELIPAGSTAEGEAAHAWREQLRRGPQLRSPDEAYSSGAGAGPVAAAAAAAAARGSSSCLTHNANLWRAYQVLSFLSHAYMWCGGAGGDPSPAPPGVLPAVLARPWALVAAALDMPPVLVYATYNLLNHRRLNPTGPLELGNLAVQHQFLGGVDEAWFRLVHVAIEAAAAPAIAALQPLQTAAAQRGAAAMELHLATLTAGLQRMQALLARMGEHCDPLVYYKRVRLPMSGWRNSPALPDGLVYEGMFGGRPVQLYGETGAQSTVAPAFDAALNIQHGEGWLRTYLLHMRLHMPAAHRAFLAELEAGPSVREAVMELNARKSLMSAYDEAVHELERFRAQHRGFAATYIAQWAKADATGTGGSDFMPALTGYKQTTAAHRLSSP